jgi:S1-C subfamily serine protease
MAITAKATGSYLAIPQVVKIFATSQPPDYGNPWRRGGTDTCTGSGVIVGPGEILTNAHVVSHATFLQVQKMADPDKAVAKVKASCHDADLALLSVEDSRFLRDTIAVPIAELPNLRDKVVVAGFPMGGDELSITEGVVSRAELQMYSHSLRMLLAVTIDAAINPGNSGGPVFREGKVVGVAFQKNTAGEAMGAMVPASLVRRFLSLAAAGQDTRVPGMGLVSQDAANPTLRRRLGLGPDDGGTLIDAVSYGSSAWGQVKPGDVLLEVDGLAVGSNGTVRYRDRFRTEFSVVLADHKIGDEIEMLVLRQGERKRLRITLQPFRSLVHFYRYDAPPTYFVYGGLVFQPLSTDYLRLWGNEWPRTAWPPLTALHLRGYLSETRQEVVVLTKTLAHPVNAGYEEYSEIVATVNGKTPRDMAEFVRLIETSQDAVDIQLEKGTHLVFDPVEVLTATPEILERYEVTRDRSADLIATAARVAVPA